MCSYHWRIDIQSSTIYAGSFLLMSKVCTDMASSGLTRALYGAMATEN